MRAYCYRCAGVGRASCKSGEEGESSADEDDDEDDDSDEEYVQPGEKKGKSQGNFRSGAAPPSLLRKLPTEPLTL